MLFLRFAILLFFITIDDRHLVASNVVDLLSINDKNAILNAIEHRTVKKDKHGSEKWIQEKYDNNGFCLSNQPKHVEQKVSENSFLTYFTSKTELGNVQINHMNRDILCRSQTTDPSDTKIGETLHRLNQNLHIGQKLDLNTQSISLTLEKVSPNNITGKHLRQSNGAEVRFPQLDINPLNKSIIINLITLPYSSIVSLTLHDQYGHIMNIKNTTNPFEILIPRKNKILMPPMVRQNVTILSTKSQFALHYINLTHNLNLSISLHIEIEPENVNLSYLFVLRFSGEPDLKTNLIDEWKLMCSKDREPGSSKYSYFIDNTRISHHQWAILGIREIEECNRDSTNDNTQFSADYSLRMYTSGCYYLDDDNHWQSDGLIVGPETNEHITQCFSTHLTTFAGGFIVLPAPVDWNSLQPDFKRNLTIYLTLIFIAVIYFATMAFSYYKDKIDANMLMVIPLRDNNQRDAYLYQLVVFTGMRANAGTKSKVHFILSGNDEDTSIRTFNGDRRVFDRGNIDSFIMAVPRSLGELSYLRVWHDNSGSGSDASWFLKYILVRDLQTMETSYFICEKWLALEKESGEIDRTLSVAGEIEKTELRHVVSKNAYRSMADNHLWFSIFAYHLPSASRFTRIQRCTCCFVLLFMSLLMNIFYYETKVAIKANENEQNGVSIGPFNFGKEEIFVGVVVELIIFLPGLLLVTLFRRSKARTPRTISPVGEAIQLIRKTKPPTGNKSNSIESKGKKFLFPWWCLIIAYVLSFLIVIVSIFFIIVRGIQYGDRVVQQWLSSIVTSFFTSVLLAQPVKVISLAIIFMCLCRKKSQVEAFIEQEDPVSEFTVSTEDAHKKFPPKSLLAKTRLDPYRSKREKAELKKLRDVRLKEVKSWLILRELFFLLLFLGVLYAISYANRDVGNANGMVNYLRHHFLKVDYNHRHNYSLQGEKKTYVYDNIRSIDDYWSWLKNVFAVKYQETLRNITTEHISSSVPSYRTNTNVGWPMLRQLRVKNESCPREALPDQRKINDCNLPYTWYNEDKNSFGIATDETTTKLSESFTYKSAKPYDTFIYSTSHATYMSGGFIHEIQGRQTGQIVKGLQNLQDHRWIDQHTRAIFLTFGLYNANANLFVYCSLLLEQLPTTRDIVLRPSFQPFKLVQLYTGADLIYCLVYLILIIYYMIVEIKLLLQMRKAYIKQFWSYINWAIIVCSWAGVGVHVLRHAAMKNMKDSLGATKGQKPINLQFFAYLDTVLTYLIGFCCFFGTLKILRLLRFNRRMSLLHLTLQKSGRQILGFSFMSAIVFFAFTALFYLLFHPHLSQFATWLDTSQTCFEMISLKFSTVKELKRVDPFIAALCLFLFIFLAVFLLSNMFVSIIVDNFTKIRQQQLKRDNEVELMQFTIGKLRQWIGMKARKRATEKIKNPVDEFPEKIDKLMIAIDKMYNNKQH